MKPIDNSYITIQGWMSSRLNLRGNDLLTFALIYGFCQDGEGRFNGSLGYVQKWLCASKPTAIAAITSLIQQGLITKHETAAGYKNAYSVNMEAIDQARKIGAEPVKELNHTGKDSLPVPVKNLYGGSKESLPYNIEYNTNHKIGERQNEKPAQISDLTTVKTRNVQEVQSNHYYYKTAVKTLETLAAAARIQYPAKFAEPYFTHQQQAGRYYDIAAPADAADAQRYLSKHIAGVNAWAKREATFTRNQDNAPGAALKLPKIQLP